MPIPDFELATIHGINSGEHLILSNRNILYNQQFYGSAIINTEIKHLPHIHLSQIIITDRCLGKGAFGEVWCGIVQSEDGAEERVAIKVSQSQRATRSATHCSVSISRRCTKAPTISRSANSCRRHS